MLYEAIKIKKTSQTFIFFIYSIIDFFDYTFLSTLTEILSSFRYHGDCKTVFLFLLQLPYILLQYYVFTMQEFLKTLFIENYVSKMNFERLSIVDKICILDVTFLKNGVSTYTFYIGFWYFFESSQFIWFPYM